LIESVLLAVVAWLLALGFSWLTLDWTSRVDPVLPYWRLKMDLRLLTILGAVALLTAGLFGLAPAVHASGRGSADGLKDGGRMSATPKTRRWTHVLLVGQFALTLALLNGAGLTAKTFYRFNGLDRAVQTSDAITTLIRLPPETYATPEQRVLFHQRLRERLLSIPSITASTIASAAPFTPAGRRALTAVDGLPVSDPSPNVVTVVVDPAYFHTVVRGLVLGEPFSELNGAAGHEAAIVNQRFADVYLGAGSPIGRHLQLRLPNARPLNFDGSLPPTPPTPPVPMTIIGVAPDIRQGDAVPTVYLPFRAEAPAAVTLIVRGSGGADRLASAARMAANAIDPDLALGAMRTLDALRDRSRAGSNATASQFGKIAGLALVFSGVGLYSVMAYAVRRRTQEIAIRMALGAPARHVRWLFLRTGVWVVAGGVVLGVPASLAVGRLLQNNVVRADARDAATLIVTIAVLVIVALIASIVPARRAIRIEPTAALRIE
jgi:putative ABC transport system permease protein